MRVTIWLRRAARRSLGVLLMTVLLTAPAAVLASHQFSDVPTSHPFHNDISAIAGAGITTGFSDGTYRPSEPVTRQAMAAFLRRSGGRAALAIATPPMSPNVSVSAGHYVTGAVPVRQLTITVPGASSDADPGQLVHLQGRVQFYGSMGTATMGCPCTFLARIRDVTSDTLSQGQFQTFESTDGSGWMYSFDVEALFPAAPGPRTYELWVSLAVRASSINAAAFGLDIHSSLSATTFPFGSQGTNR